MTAGKRSFTAQVFTALIFLLLLFFASRQRKVKPIRRKRRKRALLAPYIPLSPPDIRFPSLYKLVSLPYGYIYASYGRIPMPYSSVFIHYGWILIPVAWFLSRDVQIFILYFRLLAQFKGFLVPSVGVLSAYAAIPSPGGWIPAPIHRIFPPLRKIQAPVTAFLP